MLTRHKLLLLLLQLIKLQYITYREFQIIKYMKMCNKFVEEIT